MPKTILDVCCGGKMFYADKKDNRVLFMDIRREAPRKMSNRAVFEVSPDIVGDFTAMPFKAESFNLVIFDPPHCRCGRKSFLYMKYGTLDKNWREVLTKGFAECFRVLSPGGALIFKWCDSDKPLKEILVLAPALPLITHTAKSNSGKAKTYFCVFYKEVKDEQTNNN